MEVDIGRRPRRRLGSSAVEVAARRASTSPLQIVVDGTTIYLRAPMLGGLLGTTGWLSARDDLAATARRRWASVPRTDDPSQILESLRGVAGDLEVVGTEEVRGVATTRYTATVDLARALDRAALGPGPRARAPARALRHRALRRRRSTYGSTTTGWPAAW